MRTARVPSKTCVNLPQIHRKTCHLAWRKNKATTVKHREFRMHRRLCTEIRPTCIRLTLFPGAGRKLGARAYQILKSLHGHRDF